MKQFGKILKFELKGYLKNKAFVGVTIFLVVAIAIAMFIPNIISAFKSDDEVTTNSTDLPIMLVYAEDETLSGLVKDYFSEAFTGYNVTVADGTIEDIKSQIISGSVECAFVMNSASSYTYYVNNLNMWDSNQDFDVYNDIKVKLVNLGVPKDEVAFIHDAKTDQQKQDLFDRVRRGEIRVLIGSTEKCGAGTNIQNKLVALHHLDTPYRPSDLEQREGRIVRQGNENESVAIYTYVTKRTFDAYSYQLLESKQRFISQINKGDYTIREADDIDEATLSYAEVKAIVSDNPKIRRKMEIEQQLGQLSVLEKDHRNNRYRMQEAIIRAPEQIGAIVRSIESLKADVKTRDLHKGDQIQIGKQFFEERKDAGALLIKAVKSGQYVGKTIGYFRGFGIVPTEKRWDKYYLKLVGNGQYEVEISDSDVGTISRMENVTNDFEKEIKYGYERKERAEQELIVAKSEVDKPFEHQSEMEALQSELAEINAELDLGHTKENIVLDDETGEVPKIEILDESEEEVEIA